MTDLSTFASLHFTLAQILVYSSAKTNITSAQWQPKPSEAQYVVNVLVYHYSKVCLPSKKNHSMHVQPQTLTSPELYRLPFELQIMKQHATVKRGPVPHKF